MEKTKAFKKKLSPLTIALCVILTLYVIFMLVLFAWACLTASKAYFGDYSSLEEGVADNIIGLPKKFMLFENIGLINSGFSDYTLVQMAFNTIAYSVGCALAKVVVTCVVAYLCARYHNWF